jgi:RNA polymerase sigma factor (sigma-70 family)
MTHLDSDKALVTGLKEGRKESQECLVAMYGDILLRFIVSVLRVDETEAEDIAFETLCKAIEKVVAFEFRQDSPNGFRNWLFQIAKNILRDRWRLEQELQPLDEEMLVVPSIEYPEESSERVKAVREALAELPKNQRMTLILHFSGWRLVEIAEHYDVRPGTVRQWKARGLKTVAKLLENHPAIQEFLAITK